MSRPSGDGGAFARRYGPYALVAGASEGIGEAFASELAARGLDLVLVARRTGPLEALAERLRAGHGIEVRTIPCDLGERGAIESIAAGTVGCEIGLLAYNAASSTVGRFLEIPVEDHLRAIDVNVRGAVLLVHALGQAMVARGRGGIVLLASLTAFQGTPLVASYGATKAFDLVLAEGLWGELTEHGVDVLACCPGATTTPAYRRVTPEGVVSRFAPRPQEPEEVAREALDAIGRRPVLITGRGNRLASFFLRRLVSRRRAIVTLTNAMKARYDRPR